VCFSFCNAVLFVRVISIRGSKLTKLFFPNTHFLPGISRMILERFIISFMANGKRQFVPSDQVLLFYYSLRLHRNQKIHASFIYKNCFKQFVFANALICQIEDFNMAFVLNLSLLSLKNYLCCEC